MKRRFIVTTAITASLALCAAVWPQTEKVEKLPAPSETANVTTLQPTLPEPEELILPAITEKQESGMLEAESAPEVAAKELPIPTPEIEKQFEAEQKSAPPMQTEPAPVHPTQSESAPEPIANDTIEFIKRKPYGKKLLIKVKDEVKLVIDATSEYEPCDRQKIIEQNKKNTVRHAYFREYLALQRLCLLILQHQKHQIGAGARQIYGILFDGAWLWEEYVNSLIEDVFYHPMNKGGKGAQRLFDGNVGLIYPDFISRNSETRIIADAKYKPVDNIGNRDYLQVLAYMFRFDAKAGYYLYPEAEGSDDLKLWLNRGSTYEKNVMARDDISVTKHGLKIPVDALNYAEFSVRMKTCEQEFKRALNTM